MISTIVETLGRSRNGRKPLYFALVILAAVIAIAFTSVAGPSSSHADENQAFSNKLAESEAHSPQREAKSIADNQSLWDSANYLQFNRWKPVTDVPIPDRSVGDKNTSGMPIFVTIGIAQIGQLLFSLAITMLWLVGVLLLFTISMDVVTSVTSLVDLMFARAGLAIFYPGANSGGIQNGPIILIGLIVAVAIVITAIKLALPGRKFTYSFGTLGWTFVGLGGLLVVSMAAVKNHPDTASVAGVEQSDIANSKANDAEASDIVNGGISSDKQIEKLRDGDGNNHNAGSYTEWAMGSPGWIVTGATTLLNNVSGIISQLVDNITGVITNSGNANDTNKQYIDGMHEVFLSSGAARSSQGRANLMVSYDNIVNSLYFEPYRVGVFGDSQSSRNAFPRIAEVMAKRPAYEQIVIARSAGLYREIIGYGPIIPEYARPTVPYGYNNGPTGNGTIVKDDGNWKAAALEGGKNNMPALTIANGVFGPDYGDPQGFRIAQIYWGACNWSSGQNVKVNPEWEGAKAGDTKDKKKVIDQNACSKNNTEEGNDGDTIIWQFDENGGFGRSKDASKNDQTKLEKLGSFAKDAVTPPSQLLANKFIEKKAGTGDKYKDASLFYYTDNNDQMTYQNFVGLSSESAQKKIGQAKSPLAKQYYEHVIGSNSLGSFLPAIMSVVSSGMTAWYFSPLIMGSVFAQLLGMVLFSLGWILFILWMFPSQRLKGISQSAGLTIIAALAFSTVMTVLFTLTFFVIRLSQLIFTPFMESSLLKSTLTSAATIIGLMIIRWMIQKVSNGQIDMRKMSNTAKIGSASGAPLLSAFGFDAPTGAEIAGWFKKPKKDPTLPDLATDEDVNLGNDKDDKKDRLMLLRRPMEQAGQAINSGSWFKRKTDTKVRDDLLKNGNKKDADKDSLYNKKDDPENPSDPKRDADQKKRGGIGRALDVFNNGMANWKDPFNKNPLGKNGYLTMGNLRDAFNKGDEALGGKLGKDGKPMSSTVKELFGNMVPMNPADKANDLKSNELAENGMIRPTKGKNKDRDFLPENIPYLNKATKEELDNLPSKQERSKKLIDKIGKDMFDTTNSDRNAVEQAGALAAFGNGEFVNPNNTPVMLKNRQSAIKDYLNRRSSDQIKENDQAIANGDALSGPNGNIFGKYVPWGRNNSGDDNGILGNGSYLKGMENIHNVKVSGDEQQKYDHADSSMLDKIVNAFGFQKQFDQHQQHGANVVSGLAGAGAGVATKAAVDHAQATNAAQQAAAQAASNVASSAPGVTNASQSMPNVSSGGVPPQNVQNVQNVQQGNVTPNMMNAAQQAAPNADMGAFQSQVGESMKHMADVNNQTRSMIDSKVNLLDSTMTNTMNQHSQTIASMIGKSNFDNWNKVINQLSNSNANNAQGIVKPEQRNVVEKVTREFYDRHIKSEYSYRKGFYGASFNEKKQAEDSMLRSLMKDMENVTLRSARARSNGGQ